MALFGMLPNPFTPKNLKELEAQFRFNIGSAGYDPWGLHPETVLTVMTLYKFFYTYYFRVEPIDIDLIPAAGRVLLIGNHSGQLGGVDGFAIGTALGTRKSHPRICRAMIERYSPTVPYFGNLLNMLGGVVGDPINCIKMLEREEAVMVFPEGIRGSAKHWNKRYQLQEFGNGFMRIAIQTKTPIVPIGVIGAEETMPGFGNITPLAKLMRVPVVPLVFPMNLPAKVRLYFGEPMFFEGDPDDEPQMSQNVNAVKSEIRRLLDRGLKERKSVFRG